MKLPPLFFAALTFLDPQIKIGCVQILSNQIFYLFLFRKLSNYLFQKKEKKLFLFSFFFQFNFSTLYNS